MRNPNIYTSPELVSHIVKQASKFLRAKEDRRIAVERINGLRTQVSEATQTELEELKAIHYINTGHYKLFESLKKEVHKSNSVMRSTEVDYYTAKTHSLI
jgi:hypothetical protein